MTNELNEAFCEMNKNNYIFNESRNLYIMRIQYILLSPLKNFKYELISISLYPFLTFEVLFLNWFL